jgi:4-hydroxybenzoate polyprenyltransferase
MTLVIRNWGLFIRERFPPPVNVPFAVLLSGAAAVTALPPHDWNGTTLVKAVLLAAAFVLFLFRLRVLDEIKDCGADRRVNPDRPLARGLIPLAQAKRAAVLLAAAELFLTLPAGPPAAAAWAISAVFSFLMYKEFFAGAYLSRSLFLYALSHAPAMALAAIWVAAGVAGLWPWALRPSFAWYAASLIPVTVLYDVARKTWEPGQEKRERASYSKDMGVRGAARLTSVLVLVSGCGALLSLFRTAVPIAWLLGCAAVIAAETIVLFFTSRAGIVQFLGLVWMAGLQIAMLGGTLI